MPKYYHSSKRKQSAPKAKGRGYSSYVDRPLAKMSPEAAQEATKPTPAEAVIMQKRMAGCP